MHTVFLLFGSNIGNPFHNIDAAIKQVCLKIGNMQTSSGYYQTEAWGNRNQKKFINRIAIIATKLEPSIILKSILEIEMQLGRVRAEKWAARTIDIDILYFDDLIMETESLTIPHKYLHERNFTLIPLVEVAPDFKHPKLQLTNLQLLQQSKDKLEVLRIESIDI